MPDLPEHEERSIRDYVNGQSHDDQVTLVQKIGSERVFGQLHELYDVHCERSRWWVISDPTNLYSQDDFPEIGLALTFHLGLTVRMLDRSRADVGENGEKGASGASRRYRQAVTAMDSATEAADFQAIGIMCREALLALVHDHLEDEWLSEIPTRPKRSDFKGWGVLFAERLATGRLRGYMKDLVEGTWDLAVWLQHYADATPWEAELILDATGHLIGCFGRLLRRREHGAPERCPRCGSYAVDEDVEVVEEPETGFLKSNVCRACEWRSERSFTSWEEHFEGADIEGYLRSSTGISDRLHPRENSER